MSRVKPLLAVSSIGLGAAMAAIVVYMQSNPRAFTSERPAPARPLEMTAMEPPAAAPEVNVVTIPQVEIRGIIQRGPPVVSPPRDTVLEPCSPWHELASGPAARKVRALCEGPARALVPGS